MDSLNKPEITAEDLILFMPLGILIKDLDNKVQIVNYELLRLFNLEETPEDLTGIPIENIISKIRPFFKNTSDLSIFFHECSWKKKKKYSEFEMTKNMTVRINYSPMISNNQLLSHIWVFYPIDFNIPIEDFNYKMMQIQLEKERTIKKIRHELKNHLSTIDSSISLLDHVHSNYLNEESTNKYFEGLDGQISNLSQKINKLRKLR